MREALVFNGASNLDFQDIRTNVIRIPEVVLRIREAQSIWDTLSGIPLDLANFIASEDSVFLNHIRLRNFATAVVQVGLLDRYLKTHTLSEYVVGAVNGDSPLLVALGKKSFFDMVSESSALTGVGSKSRTGAASGMELPILSGVQLDEYGVFRRSDNGIYERLLTATAEVEKMIVSLVDLNEVSTLVMVGPGNSIFGKRILDLTSRDVQVLESIDLDPMLSWFWLNLRENRLAIAN